ncbi:hypothetical protein AB1K18_22500 [Peribacillus simplex]
MIGAGVRTPAGKTRQGETPQALALMRLGRLSAEGDVKTKLI